MALERLSAQDATFVELERPETPMHVGSVAIFEGEPFFDSGGRFRLDEVRERMLRRMHRMPRFRRRLVEIPFGLGRPVWVDDPSFRIEDHVRLVALPSPGDDEQLNELASKILCEPLDRTKPLWELWFVERLESGRVALIEKTHHSMVDGVASMSRWACLLDWKPDPEPVEPETWEPEHVPSSAELALRSLWNTVTAPRELIGSAYDALRHPRRTLHDLASLARGFGSFEPDLPFADGPLNEPVGHERRIEGATAELSDLKTVRAAFGGTVNDVFLAAVAGGLRDLLDKRGVGLEGREIRAFVPVSVRREDEEGELGNRLSALFVGLPVGEPDPARRLKLVQHTVGDLKERKQAVSAEFLASLGRFAVPTLLHMTARLVHASDYANITVTNVPGPQRPLYCMGARMEEWYGFVPLARRQTVGVVMMSYCGSLFIGVLADRDSCPDARVFAEGIDRAFEDLLDAATKRLAEQSAEKGD